MDREQWESSDGSRERERSASNRSLLLLLVRSACCCKIAIGTLVICLYLMVQVDVFVGDFASM